LTTPALLGGDAAWRPPAPLAFRDGLIVNSVTHAPVDLHGFNWAGFNYIQYGMEFFEGLHEGRDTATGDFATVVYRQQLLGFNLVRIPFRFASLFEVEEEELDPYSSSADEKEESASDGETLLARRRWRRPSRSLARRCRWTSRATLKKVLSNPTPPFYSQIDYSAIRLPKPVAPPAKPRSYAERKDANGRGGNFKNPPSCNWYLPDTTILDRMLFAVQYYVANGEFGEREERARAGRERVQKENVRKNQKKLTFFTSSTSVSLFSSSRNHSHPPKKKLPGFYVILDWHPVDEPEPAAQQDSLLVSHGRALADDWRALSAALASLPAWRDGRLPGRVLLEPINEPDRLGMAWNIGSNGRLNVTAAVEATAAKSKKNGGGGRRGSKVVVEETVVAASVAASSSGGRKLLEQQQQSAANSLPLPESEEIVFIDPRDGSVASSSELSLASTEAPFPGSKNSKNSAAAVVGVSRADLSKGTFNLTQRPLAGLLLQSTKAIHSVLGDSSLFILEGTNQSYWMPPLSWGGAFITDAAVAAEHRSQNRKYSDAAPFFDALVALPEIASRVALGPHVYGPSIGWSAQQTRGTSLWKTLSLAFGEKSSFGRKFPVIVTEFGTRLDGSDRQKVEDDLAWLTDFAKWANAWPETGNARRVRGWCWWQWSPSVSLKFFSFFLRRKKCRLFPFSLFLTFFLLSFSPLFPKTKKHFSTGLGHGGAHRGRLADPSLGQDRQPDYRQADAERDGRGLGPAAVVPRWGQSRGRRGRCCSVAVAVAVSVSVCGGAAACVKEREAERKRLLQVLLPSQTAATAALSLSLLFFSLLEFSVFS